MKFVRFGYQDGVYFGIVKEEKVAIIKGSIFSDFEVVGPEYPLSSVKLLAPVVPSKIICIARNYLEHIAEIKGKIPEEPNFFLKPPSSVIGHGDEIVIPSRAERVDYEGELAVVIKDRMKDVPEAEALNHILGCSCFNDVTERALAAKGYEYRDIAKGFDTFSAFGPYIVTGLDPNHLQLKTYLNGELRQNDNTENCVFSVEQLLSYVSQYMTLYPGDIIATATPKGIGGMKPGDVVEVELEGVGRLRNTVKSKS